MILKILLLICMLSSSACFAEGTYWTEERKTSLKIDSEKSGYVALYLNLKDHISENILNIFEKTLKFEAICILRSKVLESKVIFGKDMERGSKKHFFSGSVAGVNIISYIKISNIDFNSCVEKLSVFDVWTGKPFKENKIAEKKSKKAPLDSMVARIKNLEYIVMIQHDLIILERMAYKIKTDYLKKKCDDFESRIKALEAK